MYLYAMSCRTIFRSDSIQATETLLRLQTSCFLLLYKLQKKNAYFIAPSLNDKNISLKRHRKKKRKKTQRRQCTGKNKASNANGIRTLQPCCHCSTCHCSTKIISFSFSIENVSQGKTERLID